MKDEREENKMAQITAKELSAISDLLSVEETVIAKYKEYACRASDSVLKNQYEQMAQRHQRHFDELYANLK
jgi:rubrerythrin